ncbi:MAG: hypothetical protein ACRCYQ_08130 [Nocardioides sp.]
MVLLTAAITVLAVAFVAADGEQNLALVTLILAGVLAVPLLLAGGLWVAGVAARARSPRLAVALTALSATVAALSILFVGWFVLASR